jgi:hypothetical protein
MIGRRAFLASGLSALAAAPLLGQDKRPPLRPVKSVIWIWMDGGASQIDTWDPKPGRPNGGGLQAIDTAVPGIVVSELLPRCAAQMARLSIVRTAELPLLLDDRTPELLSDAMHCSTPPGCDEVEPATGTILAYELGRKGAPIPQFVSIDSPRIPETDWFGRDFLPFHVSPRDEETWAAGLLASRAEPVETLLRQQDQGWEKDRRSPIRGRFEAARTRAEILRNAPFLDAFRTDREPGELQKEYRDGFGRRCLQARRLVEAGVTVVEIAQHGWSAAAGAFAPIRRLAGELDAGLGTLIRDLSDRNLLKDTVVVCIGPGGRSPKLNAQGGRDGGAPTFSVVLAGGSLKGGRVVGDTGADGTEATPRVPHCNLHATIYRACGVDAEKNYMTPGHKKKYVSQNGNNITRGIPITTFFEDK